MIRHGENRCQISENLCELFARMSVLPKSGGIHAGIFY